MIFAAISLSKSDTSSTFEVAPTARFPRKSLSDAKRISFFGNSS